MEMHVNHAYPFTIGWLSLGRSQLVIIYCFALFCCRTLNAVNVAVYFNARMQLITRQLLLSWKQLAMWRCVNWRCVNTVVGQSCKIVSYSRSMSLQHSYSSVRYLCSSLPLHHVKQLADVTASTDDEPSPTEILANLVPEEEKRLKVLKLEYDVFMSTGARVPDTVSDKDWVHLLHHCPSPGSRAKYYRYLFKREKSAENDRRVRTANRLADEERRKVMDQQKRDGTYEFKNSFLLYTREITMNHWYNNNLCYALMNGPNLVFDFSFEDEMNDQELTNLVRQVRPVVADFIVCYTSH